MTPNGLQRILLDAVVPPLLFAACKKDPGNTTIRKEQISGFVQKSPFLIGIQISRILLWE
jgi:hypothetical protein